MNIPSEVAGVADTMLRVRRQLHEYPELSNREFETTRLLRAELERAGLSHIRAIGKTGLVVDVAGQGDGGIVALRGDIDALPIHETADVPFRSRVDGVMHACGHDVHTAMVLGAVLAAKAAEGLPGTIRAVFQPAEEDEPLGARSVIAGGHLAGVGAMVALHVDPDLPTGCLRLRDGPMMASSDVFEVTVTGRNSHAGWPHRGVDSIAASCAFVQQAYSVFARRVDPRTPVALNFGSIAGGSAANVLADRVVVKGVLRTLDESARPALRDLLRDALSGACGGYGASGEITFLEGEPVLRNDPAVSQAMRRAGMRVLGDAAVSELAQPTMSGEDFAFYGAHVPTSMAWIGCRNEALGFTAPLHHPGFAVDEAVMPRGAAVLLEAATDLLQRSPATPESI